MGKVKLMECYMCPGSMEPEMVPDSEGGLTRSALVALIIGVALMFFFPLGTIAGAVIVVLAYEWGRKKTLVWKCADCGFVYSPFDVEQDESWSFRSEGGKGSISDPLKEAWAAFDAGRDHLPALREMQLRSLKQMARAQMPEEPFLQLIADHAQPLCPACEARAGSIVRIQDELESPSLPVPGCTCRAEAPGQAGMCLCRYECVFMDELEMSKRR